jgi:hypothetical protein
MPGGITGPYRYGDLVLHYLRMTELMRASSNCKQQTHLLLRENVT